MTFKRYALESACVSYHVLASFTFSSWLNLIVGVTKTQNTMYRGLSSGYNPTYDPQGVLEEEQRLENQAAKIGQSTPSNCGQQVRRRPIVWGHRFTISCRKLTTILHNLLSKQHPEARVVAQSMPVTWVRQWGSCKSCWTLLPRLGVIWKFTPNIF